MLSKVRVTRMTVMAYREDLAVRFGNVISDPIRSASDSDRNQKASAYDRLNRGLFDQRILIFTCYEGGI